MAVTKISILTLYLRLAAENSFRRLVWIVIVFVSVSWIPNILGVIFQCSPVHKAWDMKTRGHCININALFFANAGVDIFQDALIYVLPMRMLYQLQLPSRERYAIMGVFAVGAFVVITGMIRLKFLAAAKSTRDPSCELQSTSFLTDR